MTSENSQFGFLKYTGNRDVDNKGKNCEPAKKINEVNTNGLIEAIVPEVSPVSAASVALNYFKNENKSMNNSTPRFNNFNNYKMIKKRKEEIINPIQSSKNYEHFKPSSISVNKFLNTRQRTLNPYNIKQNNVQVKNTGSTLKNNEHNNLLNHEEYNNFNNTFTNSSLITTKKITEFFDSDGNLKFSKTKMINILPDGTKIVDTVFKNRLDSCKTGSDSKKDHTLLKNSINNNKMIRFEDDMDFVDNYLEFEDSGYSSNKNRKSLIRYKPKLDTFNINPYNNSIEKNSSNKNLNNKLVLRNEEPKKNLENKKKNDSFDYLADEIKTSFSFLDITDNKTFDIKNEFKLNDSFFNDNLKRLKLNLPTNNLPNEFTKENKLNHPSIKNDHKTPFIYNKIITKNSAHKLENSLFIKNISNSKKKLTDEEMYEAALNVALKKVYGSEEENSFARKKLLQRSREIRENKKLFLKSPLYYTLKLKKKILVNSFPFFNYFKNRTKSVSKSSETSSLSKSDRKSNSISSSFKKIEDSRGGLNLIDVNLGQKIKNNAKPKVLKQKLDVKLNKFLKENNLLFKNSENQSRKNTINDFSTNLEELNTAKNNFYNSCDSTKYINHDSNYNDVDLNQISTLNNNYLKQSVNDLNDIQNKSTLSKTLMNFFYDKSSFSDKSNNILLNHNQSEEKHKPKDKKYNFINTEILGKASDIKGLSSCSEFLVNNSILDIGKKKNIDSDYNDLISTSTNSIDSHKNKTAMIKKKKKMQKTYTDFYRSDNDSSFTNSMKLVISDKKKKKKKKKNFKPKFLKIKRFI